MENSVRDILGTETTPTPRPTVPPYTHHTHHQTMGVKGTFDAISGGWVFDTPQYGLGILVDMKFHINLLETLQWRKCHFTDTRDSNIGKLAIENIKNIPPNSHAISLILMKFCNS